MGLSKTSASRGCQGVDGSAGSGPETEEAVAAMGVPGSVGVIGGGRMGAGIAQVFATHGAAVSVVESDESAAVAARERIAEGRPRPSAASCPGSPT